MANAARHATEHARATRHLSSASKSGTTGADDDDPPVADMYTEMDRCTGDHKGKRARNGDLHLCSSSS